MSVYLTCPDGCGYSVKWTDSYDDAVDELRRHRERTHGSEPEPVTDGGMVQRKPTVDWPLTVNGHTVEKTHAPGLSSQHVACQGCDATAIYSVHDIDATSSLDDLVTVLIDRLPDRCQPTAARREVAVDE